MLELGQKIQNEARSEIEKMQREYFLREQLKAIQRELGEGDEQAADVEEFRKKIEAAGMPEEAEKQARRELDRLSRLPTAAAEYGVIRTYLDWLVSLPWSKATADNLDIAHARAGARPGPLRPGRCQGAHPGIPGRAQAAPGAQGRVCRPMPARMTSAASAKASSCASSVRPGSARPPWASPSPARWAASSSASPWAAMRDEAEIRGHRRTYIGAMPGRIIQALRRIETRNPVFMLDEVDKLSFDFHGDPASALLEVLDPEQNVEFRDHYLEVPFDLSQVMFITTANTLETIPGPLLDRMEIIQHRRLHRKREGRDRPELPDPAPAAGKWPAPEEVQFHR